MPPNAFGAIRTELGPANPEQVSERGSLDDPHCPFCMIARGEDASVEVVCEGDSWVAFFPREPATPGHTLVIPRVHVRDLWELQQPLDAELISAVGAVGRAIQEGLNPEGMNLISSSGAAAEQTVFHLHLHVVPRWHRDRIGRIWPPKRRMVEQLTEAVAAQIRAACASPDVRSRSADR